MTPREQYLAMIANDTLKKADAIVILEGDGFARIPEGVRLYKEGWAPVVVISGGVNNPPHSTTASEMMPEVVKLGVPQSAILLEEKSQHTRDQAVYLSAICKERGWTRMIMVASHYHQYRAYLTLFKGLQEAGLDRAVELINAPARDLPWFAHETQGRRIDLLQGEFERIERYAPQGHLASYEDVLAYQEWKEQQA
jgi:uncharacterized SAM-binding protein YcdF (DUF218 family)